MFDIQYRQRYILTIHDKISSENNTKYCLIMYHKLCIILQICIEVFKNFWIRELFQQRLSINYTSIAEISSKTIVLSFYYSPHFGFPTGLLHTLSVLNLLM